MDKDGRVLLNRQNFIYINDNPIQSKSLEFLNFNCIIYMLAASAHDSVPFGIIDD
jgi:hypothetical protein